HVVPLPGARQSGGALAAVGVALGGDAVDERAVAAVVGRPLLADHVTVAVALRGDDVRGRAVTDPARGGAALAGGTAHPIARIGRGAEAEVARLVAVARQIRRQPAHRVLEPGVIRIAPAEAPGARQPPVV